MRFLFPAFLLFLFGPASCRKAKVEPPFVTQPEIRTVQPAFNELSGMADSRRYPGFWWGQEDSGNPAQLRLVRHDGTVVRTIGVRGATNRDWEELALSGNLLYIAETGDNAHAYSEYRFYILAEPDSTLDSASVTQILRFTYSDGPHDCEGFFVDGPSKDIYLFTKREARSRVYRIAAPYAAVNVAQYVGELPYTGVTGAALSADEKELIVRTYSTLNYYTRRDGQSWPQVLASAPQELGFVAEPQGESVGFLQNGSGFFTGSERAFGSGVHLYFYRRR